MIFHYFKIAFRNLWKFKGQSLISILGLAVGFTCFALATLWIRYEMTFDSFHKNAKQMYVVYSPDPFRDGGYGRKNAYRLSFYLKETFPEISNAISLSSSTPTDKVTLDGVDYPASTVTGDTSLLRMFDVKILKGSRDFLIPGSNKLAITQEKAIQLFGNENPIGKKVNNGANEICAVVSSMPGHSSYAFDLIRPFSERMAASQSLSGYEAETIIELFSGTDIEAFEKKLYEHDFSGTNRNFGKLIIKPITKMRYMDTNIKREVKFQHIIIFAVSGLLVILCSLFNYLTLFVSRFRIRQKELALRVVCGASGRSLLAMLSVEFMLTLLFAIVLGFTLTRWLHETFLTLSEIQMGFSAIYRESLLYIAGVIFISFLVFWLLLLIFRHRNLNLSMQRSNKKTFRKISIVAQLIISIGFAFCTIVILKQIYFLHHTDELGFSFKNRGSIMLLNPISDVLANQMKQIPEIVEVIDAKAAARLLPGGGPSIGTSFDSWEDKPADAGEIKIPSTIISPVHITFYDFRLVAGEMLTNEDPKSMVLINESAVKAFGWRDPVGKHFGPDNEYTVKGVVKNVYNLGPTVPAEPVCYLNHSMAWHPACFVLFKYQEGVWQSCKEKIEALLEKEHNNIRYALTNDDEEFNKFLKSERALIKLLSFVSAICVLICVFGFVSLVSLTCEERRKSIAIRKINGATVRDILAMFAKEYTLLLFVGSAIAFTACFLIMQRWLEQYVKQTDIPVWIYVSILCIMALVIVLCVGWQVYKTSIENPAEVIKSE